MFPYGPVDDPRSDETRSGVTGKRPRVRLPLWSAFLVLVFLVPLCVYGAGCALSVTGEDLGELTDLAVTLMSAKRYDEALPVQERIAALDPEDAQIRVELGFNYLSHQNRPADAVRVMAEAVELEPSARNLTFLAQAQLGDGNRDAAETTLRQAIATDKGYPHTYQVLVQLLEESHRSAEIEGIVDLARENGVDLSTLTAGGV
jgi:tetratricopeptide (TPR) repeat protein